MKRIFAGALIVGIVASHAATTVAAETPHLVFVTEYARELGVNEHDRALAEREIAEQTGDKNAAIIRSSARIVLELTAQTNILKAITMLKTYDDLPASITGFYDYKIKVHNQMIDLASAFMSGPKPGVDYGAMAADATKLGAMLEYIDRSLFQTTPLIFSTLIDTRPDKNGHVSRLIITRAQRDDLVRGLQIDFGKQLDQGGDQTSLVSSAIVLRDYLSKKGYKCSDEPL